MQFPQTYKKQKKFKKKKKGKTLEEQKQSLKLLVFSLSSCFKDEMIYSFDNYILSVLYTTGTPLAPEPLQVRPGLYFGWGERHKIPHDRH